MTRTLAKTTTDEPGTIFGARGGTAGASDSAALWISAAARELVHADEANEGLHKIGIELCASVLLELVEGQLMGACRPVGRVHDHGREGVGN